MLWKVLKKMKIFCPRTRIYYPAGHWQLLYINFDGSKLKCGHSGDKIELRVELKEAAFVLNTSFSMSVVMDVTGWGVILPMTHADS